VSRLLPGGPPTSRNSQKKCKEQMMTTTHQQRVKVPSEALPSDGLSRFVRAGAWAAMVSGLALVVSLLMEWLVVPYEDEFRVLPQAVRRGYLFELALLMGLEALDDILTEPDDTVLVVLGRDDDRA
jgi:hypothetical protein